MFDYLNTPGFLLRTTLQAGDVQQLETAYPGWILQTLRSWSSRINSQLRKRYGDSANVANILPLGQQAPVLLGAGTNPPVVTLVGRPTLGCVELMLQILGGGADPTFQWSTNGGAVWTPGGTVSGIMPVPIAYGMSAIFGLGTYSVDNVYAASPPVPETVLQWLTILVTWDCYTKRGRNPQDPLIVDLRDDRVRVLAEIKEAADSKDGLYDLPVSEDRDTAITTGSPLGYSEQSPYAWIDRQVASLQCGLQRGFEAGGFR